MKDEDILSTWKRLVAAWIDLHRVLERDGVGSPEEYYFWAITNSALKELSNTMLDSTAQSELETYIIQTMDGTLDPSSKLLH